MDSEQFRTPRGTSSNASARCPAAIAAQRAALLFGCYRRGDANDPDVYAAAVGAVLSTFDEATVIFITDPRTGLPGKCQWLPSVAEVRTACEEREAHVARLHDFNARFANRKPLPALPLDRSTPGRRANVFVGAGDAQYQRVSELVKAADEADWKLDPEGRPGVWIALNLLLDGAPRMPHLQQPFQTMNDEQLRARYKRDEALPEAAE